uniref:Uncharacterized protein n=1 Tax=Glossina palpalis gambiensis TaxID=67801 RepID=A0A1B0AYY4_9MUSC
MTLNSLYSRREIGLLTNNARTTSTFDILFTSSGVVAAFFPKTSKNNVSTLTLTSHPTRLSEEAVNIENKRYKALPTDATEPKNGSNTSGAIISSFLICLITSFLRIIVCFKSPTTGNMIIYVY